MTARLRSYKGLLTVAVIDGHEEEVNWYDAVDVIGFDACKSTTDFASALPRSRAS